MRGISAVGFILSEFKNGAALSAKRKQTLQSPKKKLSKSRNMKLILVSNR